MWALCLVATWKFPIWGGVVIGMCIVGFFALIGGMKGITWTQVIQYCVLIVAFLIPAVVISKQLTGNPLPQAGILTGDVTSKLDGVYQDFGLDKYTDSFNQMSGWSMLNVFAITLALMIGTAGLPHVIVRFYTTRTVRAARFSAFLGPVFYRHFIYHGTGRGDFCPHESDVGVPQPPG